MVPPLGAAAAGAEVEAAGAAGALVASVAGLAGATVGAGTAAGEHAAAIVRAATVPAMSIATLVLPSICSSSSISSQKPAPHCARRDAGAPRPGMHGSAPPKQR